MFNKTGFISFLCLILLQILCVGSFALSVRSIGMGDVYPPTGRDPSAIFYNPAYLANCDSIRLSLDNMNGPMDPKDNIALSMGDLGIASSSLGNGSVFYLATGMNTYSFLRLGIGAKFYNDQKDFDVGFDWDVVKNVGLSVALLNEEDKVLPRQYSATIAYKSDDGDKCLALNSDLSGNVRLGYEKQFTEKAFWRVGYNVDHPSLGCTLPLYQNIDFDLAAELGKDNTKILFGIELFRNTENKRVNSEHSINFGKAIVGEDEIYQNRRIQYPLCGIRLRPRSCPYRRRHTLHTSLGSLH